MQLHPPATRLSGLAEEISVKFRHELTKAIANVTEAGLSASTFVQFLDEVKAAVNDAGLASIERTVTGLDEEVARIEFTGRVMRYRGSERKDWLTPFGVARPTRRYYAPDGGGAGVAHIDVLCGMVDRYMTPDVEEMAAFSAAHLPPGEAEQLLNKALPVGPSATAISRTVFDVGSFLEEHREAVENSIEREAPLTRNAEDGDDLVVSWDGVMVPEREACKSNASMEAEDRGCTDHSKNDRKKWKTRWKEAGVASVSLYRNGENGPKRVDFRYFARMPEEGMATLLAQHSDVVARLVGQWKFRRVVVLCDGSRCIWNTAASTPIYSAAAIIEILDFYHAAEHLSEAGEAIFGDSDAAKPWFEKHRESLILDDAGVDKLIRSLSYYRASMRKGSKRDTIVRRAIGYFRRNRHRMRYKSFIDQGLPIGSGPIEAACKTVAGARLKRSGMRWSKDGGQRVLNLRILVKDDRWDAAWQTYLGSRMCLN
jgi:hypothetical protein